MNGRTLVLAVASAVAVVLGPAACGADDSGRAVKGGDAARGSEVIAASGCGSCHTIPGVDGADADAAPPLDHWSRRAFIGGQLPNEPEGLVRWLLDPEAIDPGTAMPDVGLTAEEARDVAAYLMSIR